MPRKAKPITDEEIDQMARALNCSREDALDVIESDRAIDRGERVWFDMDKDAEKEALKDAHKGQKHTVYNFTQRERKANPEKQEIIAKIAEALTADFEGEVSITNKEREVSFKFGENDYSITLVCHRKPKK